MSDTKIVDLLELQDTWERLGTIDPFWAILTEPDKQGRRWNASEFFETGAVEIAEVIQHINSLKIPLVCGTALDFGCGVGRLTQALCIYFDKCCGVDIAPSMIELAKRYNRYPDRCQYYLNSQPDLGLFSTNSIDFLYSARVLQHIRPSLSKHYLTEFVRVLKPGGVLVVQVPSAVNTSVIDDSTFRASIDLIGQTNLRVMVGQPITLQVRVQNLSPHIWIASRHMSPPIRLGNHWWSTTGDNILNDSRSDLPVDLYPMESVDLSLTTNAPQTAGIYQLELDMVQECVAWFKEKGSQTLNLTVAVEERYGTTCNATHREPIMEMHIIPKDEALKILSNLGNVVDVVQDTKSDAVWVSYTYFVKKN